MKYAIIALTAALFALFAFATSALADEATAPGSVDPAKFSNFVGTWDNRAFKNHTWFQVQEVQPDGKLVLKLKYQDQPREVSGVGYILEGQPRIRVVFGAVRFNLEWTSLFGGTLQGTVSVPGVRDHDAKFYKEK